MSELDDLAAFRPDWDGQCDVCGQGPTVSATGLCGPCTWGEANTIGGAWWDEEDEKRYQELRATDPSSTPQR
jgi:hypothetical protein